MAAWLFGFLATLALGSALGVILQRNPVHSLMALIVTLLVTAVFFMALGAVTIGFLQAIIYAGAIMVLFLFVIWLLNIQAEERESGHLALKSFGALAAAALVAELLAITARTPAPAVAAKPSPAYGTIETLAAALFSHYLIAFEATSLLLLVAIVGAVALARRMPRRRSTAASPAAASASATGEDVSAPEVSRRVASA